ncbi:MAG: hypothetical protein RL699_1690 [Bacteroidota bacterium]
MKTSKQLRFSVLLPLYKGVVLFVLCSIGSVQAQVRVDFTQRASQYSPNKKIYTLKGDFTMLGNTCLSPQNYSPTTNNNGQYMVYVDSDNDPTTFNSSSSTLMLSNENGAVPSCSSIVYAGLYWTGKSNTNDVFQVTKDIPNGMQTINNSATVNHNNNIPNSNFTLIVTRNTNSINNYNPKYTFAGNGSTYVFSFNNADAVNRVTVSVNGSAEIAVAATINAAGTEATLNSPYQITDGTATLGIQKLVRNASTDQTLSTYQLTSSALVNITGTVPAFLALTKTYDKRKISLKGPNAAAYTQFTAEPNSIYFPSATVDDNIFTAYTEVTDYVREHGIGEYFAADMALQEGLVSGTGYSGGWGIIVVYQNAKMKQRDITLFDGYAYVNSGNTVGYALPVSGFNTIQTGEVGVKLGVMASEGDVNFTGDYFKIQKQSDGSYLNLSHSGNSPTNFFNSSIITGGLRNPYLVNNTGIDISMFNVPNTNNAVIGNNQTATNFMYGTNGDTYSIFAIAMSVDAYNANVENILQPTTINSTALTSLTNLSCLPGENIAYQIQVKNLGNEAINNYKVILPIPYNANYVPGSASTELFFSPTPALNSVTFNPEYGSQGALTWELGQLPLDANPDQVMATFHFTLRATQDCQLLASSNCGSVISAQGLSSGTGAITGISFSNANLISGYQSNGNCTDEPIIAATPINIDAAAYVQSCPEFTGPRNINWCTTNNSVSTADLIAYFPAGTLFYNEFPLTGTTQQFTALNPIPLVGNNSAVVYAVSLANSSCATPFRLNRCGSIQGNNDIGSTVNGVLGGVSFTNVLANDLLNGQAVTGTAVVLSFISATHPGISLNGSNVVVAPGTPAGSYLLTYQLCEAANLTNCATATVSVVVANNTLLAQDDTYTVVACGTNQVLNSVLQNDLAVNGSAQSSNVTLTQISSSNSALQLNLVDGTIQTSGLAVGTYTLIYSICDVTTTTLCAEAIVTIQVSDTTPPVLPTLNAVQASCNYTFEIPSAVDGCSGTVIATTTDPLFYDTIGIHTVTWRFRDLAGNESNTTQTVTITAENTEQTLAHYVACNNDNSEEVNVDLTQLLPSDVAGLGNWEDTDNSTGLVGNTFIPYQIPVGTYRFTYTVQNGSCTQKVVVNLQLDNDCIVEPIGTCILVVHNAVTVNDDRTNDVLFIENITDSACFVANKVEVYNRWGVLVFESNQYDNDAHAFRGYSQGRSTVGSDALPTGTYFYTVQGTKPDGTIVRKQGYLYLTR